MPSPRTLYRPSQETGLAPIHSVPQVDRWIGAMLGKYRIESRLGRGGMGVVYRAVDTLLQRDVAIKLLPDDISRDAEAVRKFLREARAAAKVSHANIVSVYEADQQAGISYIVMEVMERGTAQDRLRSWGPFPWGEATRVVADTCRGLVAVHAAGLIHRDIKPSNIMRSHDGTVKLADFGLALVTRQDTDAITPRGQVIGTPLYMSPEQCQAKPADGRSDIYALGITYYTLLTNRVPFDGTYPQEVLTAHCFAPLPDPRLLEPSIPAECIQILFRMVAKNPADRYPTPGTLLNDLEALLTHDSIREAAPHEWATEIEPSRADASTVTDPQSRFHRSTRWWFVGLCVCLMGIAFWAGRLFRGDEGPAVVEPGSDADSKQEPPTDLPNPSVQPGHWIALPEVVARGSISWLAWNPHQEGGLAWATQQGAVTLQSREGKVSFQHRFDRFQQAIFAEKEAVLAIVANNEFRFFDPITGKARADLERYYDPQGAVIASAYQPQALTLAVLVRGNDRNYRILTKSAAGEFAERYRDPGAMTALAYGQSASIMAAGQADGTLLFWDSSGKTLPVLKVADGAVQSIRFLGSDSIVAALVGKRLAIWDTVKRKSLATIEIGEAANNFAVSGNGHWLAVPSATGIQLYDLQDPRRPSVTQLPNNLGAFTAVAFQDLPLRLAASSSDSKIHLWSLSP